MPRQFFWHSAQAIEKYLKASLVLNGYSIKNISHKLSKAFDTVRSYGADFLPEFNLPNQNLVLNKNLDFWKEESHGNFIARIEQNGTPSNRYDYFGVHLKIADLYKLDQLVFSLRNLSVNLNDVYDDVAEHKYKGFKYAQILKLNPKGQLFPFNAKLINDKRYCKSLYDIARDNNYVFAREYDHTITPLKMIMKTSNLEMLYAGDYFSHARETRSWFEANFRDLTPADKKRLQDLQNDSP